MIDAEQLKANIARNLTEYRKGEGLTQLEIAEKLNYTDKAVSKWERGESIPDVAVLMQLAELYGVSLEDITAEKFRPKFSLSIKRVTGHKMFVPILSAGLVWLVATIVFVFLQLFKVDNFPWLVFIYAVPASLIVLLVFNSIWGNNIFAAIIVSLLTWSLILAVLLPLHLYSALDNPWWIFLIGVPMQALIIFWYLLRTKGRTKTEK